MSSSIFIFIIVAKNISVILKMWSIIGIKPFLCSYFANLKSTLSIKLSKHPPPHAVLLVSS